MSGFIHPLTKPHHIINNGSSKSKILLVYPLPPVQPLPWVHLMSMNMNHQELPASSQTLNSNCIRFSSSFVTQFRSNITQKCSGTGSFSINILLSDHNPQSFQRAFIVLPNSHSKLIGKIVSGYMCGPLNQAAWTHILLQSLPNWVNVGKGLNFLI